MIEGISIAVMGAQLMYFMKKVVEMSKIQEKTVYRVNQLEEHH